MAYLYSCGVLLSSLSALAFGGSSDRMPFETRADPSPNNITHHGNSDLICTPIKWYQIFTFFAVNYFSHAATVTSYPGEPISDSILDAVIALFFPYGGIARGMSALFKFAIRYHKLFGGSDVRMAAQAGALYVVVRSKDWAPAMAHKPIIGTKIKKSNKILVPAKHWWRRSNREVTEFESEIELTETMQERHAKLRVQKQGWAHNFISAPAYVRNVHGCCKVPDGYTLAILPGNAEIVLNASNGAESSREITLPCTYNFLKVIAAIVQVIFATNTLYRTRGDQIPLYGYAAFGFTVIPYVIMSLMNLLGSLATPQYSAIYMVRSREMEEAEQWHNIKFDGMIGTVVHDEKKAVAVGVFGQDQLGRSAFRHRRLPEDRQGRHTILEGSSAASFMADLDAESQDFWTVNRAGDESGYFIDVPFCTPIKTKGREPGTSLFVAMVTFLATYALPAVPFAVIGGITRFNPGESTLAQRVWIMMWLVLGIALAPQSFMRYNEDEPRRKKNSFLSSLSLWGICVLSFYVTPAIGGMVVVGQMLRSYGYCVEIGH